MSMRKEREQFFVYAAQWGIDYETARLLLRDAATIQRWAIEECNGTIQREEDENETPYRYYELGNGEHVKSRRPIRDSEKHARERIIRRLAALGLQLWFQGDPRGWCVRVAKGDASRDDMYTGRAPMLGVPAEG